MGNLLSRLRSLTGAGASGPTEKDAEVTVDYGLEQLEKAREEIVRSVGEIRLIQNRLKSQRSEVVEAIHGYEEQARKAMESGREGQAKAVLREKQGAESRLAELEAKIADLERQATELEETRPEIEREITLLQSAEDSPQVQEEVNEALKEIPKDLAALGHVLYEAQAEIGEMESDSAPGEEAEAEKEVFGWHEPGEETDDSEPQDNKPDLTLDEELAQLKKEVEEQ
jgi:phage shock protein A